jgi:RNA polymerase sigma factor (TIGR02999 family)
LLPLTINATYLKKPSQKKFKKFAIIAFEMNQSEQITVLLQEWSSGKREALDELLPLVYDELHKQARRYLRKERQDHTLQTTALIHEAYLKLIDQRNVEWQNRTHFFAIAAQMMRRILVDHARTRHRDKRGGKDVKISLEEIGFVVSKEMNVDLIALDDALNRLGAIDKQQVQVVELRYFSGLSLEETAEALSISRATAARDWAIAKSWLHRELTR